MDKVIGQRVLGGVVLVAAAILFLPLVLEGAGVAALQAPEIPSQPATPKAEDLAPALQNQAAALEKSIAESHGEPTFYPVQPATQSAPEMTEDVPERFRLAEPDNTKVADAAPVVPAVKKVVSPPSPDKPITPVQTVVATPVQKPVPVATAIKPNVKAPVKVAEAKPAIKAVDAIPANSGLPTAWVVQVASLSSKASADELVSRLRKKGFRAAAAQQGAVNKVSVGPELDRSIAESLLQRLNTDAELKLNGFIAPYRP